jgi:phosphoserine aminotransferase
MPTVNRIFNFAAGPAVLPLPVLEEIQRDLVSLPGVGMSILEISHRSDTFEAVLAKAEPTSAPSATSRPTTRCCSCRAARARSSRWCR